VEWNLHFMAISFFVCFTLFNIKKSHVIHTYPKPKNTEQPAVAIAKDTPHATAKPESLV